MEDKYHFRLAGALTLIPSVSEKPVKSLREYFQQHPERHSSCSVSRQGTEKMDISSGQVRSPGEVQGVDLSTWNPAEAPVAGVDI